MLLDHICRAVVTAEQWQVQSNGNCRALATWQLLDALHCLSAGTSCVWQVMGGVKQHSNIKQQLLRTMGVKVFIVAASYYVCHPQ